MVKCLYDISVSLKIVTDKSIEYVSDLNYRVEFSGRRVPLY